MQRLGPKQEPDLIHARRVVEDVSWLSTHHSYAQAAKRLAEVLQAVEQHLDQVREALDSARVDGNGLTARQLAEFERDHRRLALLVEEAQTFNSRSEATRCKACLRRLARALERHERREDELLGRLAQSRSPATSLESRR